MSILSIQGLNKSFGSSEIIKNLSLEVPQNSIYGFLGQNGAGKTTTMKMVLGLIKADSGKIAVCGEEVCYGISRTNRHIGFLSDVPEFYGYMKAVEYLSLCGDICGIPRIETNERANKLLSLVGLDGAKKKISSYSRGMKQRLGIAQALLNEPKLLICDEPTSALDPMGRKEILDIMFSVKEKTTIVFSTHILTDVERICDHAAVLHNGEIVLNGELNKLRQGKAVDAVKAVFKNTNEITRLISNPEIQGIMSEIRIEDNKLTIKSQDIHSAQTRLYKALADVKVFPEKIELVEPTLESLFLEVTK